MKKFKCSDCAGGPCFYETAYPFDEETWMKPIQCPIDEHGVGSAIWIEEKEAVQSAPNKPQHETDLK